VREGIVDFGTEILKEAGHDGKTADQDTSCHFGGRPEAHAEDVVADVCRLDNLPRVDGTYDGGGPGARVGMS